MSIIYGFLRGILSVFSLLTPLSYSGHDSLFRYLSFDLKTGGYDSILPLIVKLAVIISISYFLKKDLISLFKSTGSLLKNNKENTKSHPLPLMVFAGGLVMLLMLPLKILFKGISDYIIIAAVGFILSAVFVISSLKVKEKNLKESNESILNGMIVAFFNVLSCIPGISGFGGMYYAGLISGFRREFAVKFAYILILLWAVCSFIYEIIFGFVTGFIINFDILYYIFFALGAIGISGASIFAVSKALQNKKTMLFAFYNIAISIITLLIMIRG